MKRLSIEQIKTLEISELVGLNDAFMRNAAEIIADKFDEVQDVCDIDGDSYSASLAENVLALMFSSAFDALWYQDDMPSYFDADTKEDEGRVDDLRCALGARFAEFAGESLPIDASVRYDWNEFIVTID